MQNRNLLYILILIILPISGFAQKGENLVKEERLQYLGPNDGPFGKVQLLEETEEKILEFQTTKQPQFIYKLATRIPLKVNQDFKEGEVFLVSFKAKTISSEIETGEARTHWLLKQSDSYKDNLQYTLSFSSEWKEYFIPFQLSKDTKEDELGLVVQYGYRPQKFQLKDLKFEYFGSRSLESLPKTRITYAGMEADAEWRKEAFDRIQQYRTTEFTLNFESEDKDAEDNPVQIQLVEHDFSWGAAVGADAILEDPQLLEYLQKGFNKVVFENDLKIKSWSNKKRQERTLKAIEQLRENGLRTKGHVLIWPGFRYLTNDFETNKDDPEKIKTMIQDHVAGILKATSPNIDNWDVVNEVYTNKDLQSITGSEEVLYDGFRQAAKLAPGAERFTNEYGIISKGGLDTQKQEWYFDFIKRIDENTNGLVDGIGIQCHIGSDLTSPEKVLDILDYYAQLDKKISISEFTMDIEDPEIRENYTRDFIIAAFSHPNVSEFLFWGFKEDEKGKVDIFKENWKPGAMGMGFYRLMANEFNTSFVAQPENGSVKSRGFYGTYRYTTIQGNKQVTGTFKLKPGSSKTINIEL